MDPLRARLIRLAHDNPDFRQHILPVLKEATVDKADVVSVVKILEETNKALIRGVHTALGAAAANNAKVYPPNGGRILKLTRFGDPKVSQSMTGVEAVVSVPGVGNIKRGIVVSVNSTLDMGSFQLQKKTGAKEIHFPIQDLPKEAEKVAATFFSLTSGKAAGDGPRLAAPVDKERALKKLLGNEVKDRGSNLKSLHQRILEERVGLDKAAWRFNNDPEFKKVVEAYSGILRAFDKAFAAMEELGKKYGV